MSNLLFEPQHGGTFRASAAALVCDLQSQRHSETSVAAANTASKTATGDRARVLGLLICRGDRGATDEEMQIELGMNPSTQRPRRIELVKLRTVADSGETRPTKSGSKATVWIASIGQAKGA